MAGLWLYLSSVVSNLLLAGAVDLQAAVRQSVFRDTGLLDVLPNTENALFEETARSLLDCARRCSNTGRDCKAFTYVHGSSSSWSCRGHSAMVTSEGDSAVTMTGARSYQTSGIQWEDTSETVMENTDGAWERERVI